ncbi:MAG: type III-B CRISPR-associated protein Cas10/Cmr2 [Thermoprotei archaeon]|nr:MAG: type III-B CRISPR-associated protein Cas10/Cmr2 [Thermoprotei archaeon]
MTLALPKLDGLKWGGEEGLAEIVRACSNRGELRSFILESYKRSWEQLLESVEGDGNSCVLRIAKTLIQEYRDYFSDPPIAPRLAVIDVGRVYDEYVDKPLEKGDLEGLRALIGEEFERAVREAVEDLEIKPRELLSKLFYHILFTLILRREVQYLKLCEKRIPCSPKLLQLTQNYEDFVKKHESSFMSIARTDRRIWRYCTVCGVRPAIVRFPISDAVYAKEVGRAGIDEGDLPMLKAWFKPGEALCPLCIVKRALKDVVENRVPDALKKVIRVRPVESVEEISNKYLLRVLESRSEDVEEMLRRTKHLRESEYAVMNILLEFIEKGRFSYDEMLENLKREGIAAESNFKALLDETLRRLIRLGVIPREDFLKESWAKFRDYYAIIRGDGDWMGKVVGGNLEMEAREYAEKVLEILKPYLNSGLAQRYEECCEHAARLVRGLGGGTVLLSPSYHSSLSASLMVTALKDVEVVHGGELGAVVFAGGDDLAALAPVERVFDIILRTREHYWGDDRGFHSIGPSGRVRVPALVAYGRSYCARIAHVRDPLQRELRVANRLLDEVKEVEWRADGETLKKDSLSLSYGRTSTGIPVASKLPLHPSVKTVEKLRDIWIKMLKGKISMNFPEDAAALREEMVLLLKYGKEDSAKELFSYLVKRNLANLAEDSAMAEALVEDLVQAGVFKYWRAPLGGERKLAPLLGEFLLSLQMVRNLPR